MCTDRDLSDDLFQETLIKTWKGIRNYNDQNKFSSWLFTIAHNVIWDNFRKNKKQKMFSDIENIEPISSKENLQNEIENRETVILVQQKLNRLPAGQREVFLLREYSGLSFKEIAELRNEPINTVLSHMRYAVKKIKKALEAENAD